jgi:Arc/MetJ family transcription regulator
LDAHEYDIDDRLMAETMRRSGASTKKAAVEAGLRLLAGTFAQGSIRRLRGKLEWEGDLAQSCVSIPERFF